jgi:hypothetical protein
MVSKIFLGILMLISFNSYSQIPSEEIVESNKFNCDERILLHYSNEEVLAMDSLKFEMIKYYYCNSYILDTSNVTNFNINHFDISIYEELRSDTKYVTLNIYGLIITLIPRSKYTKKLTVLKQN